MASIQDWTQPAAPGIADVLAQLFGGAAKGSAGIEESRRAELERRRREGEAGMARLIQMLGLQEKQREFDVAEQGRAEVRKRQQEEFEAERAFPELAAPVVEEQNIPTLGEPRGPIEREPPGFTVQQQTRPATPEEFFRRGAERKLSLSALAKAAESREKIATGFKKPPSLISVAPGATLFDPETKAPIFTGPERPEKPTEYGGKRAAAIAALETVGKPLTEANIANMIRQQGGETEIGIHLGKERALLGETEGPAGEPLAARRVRIEGTAKAALPQATTETEREKEAVRGRAAGLSDALVTTATKHPDWFGGPFGLRGRARSWQVKLNEAPEGFAKFLVDYQEVRGTYARAMAGAQLGPGEKELYLPYLPDINNDADELFIAKLRAMPERLRELEELTRQRRMQPTGPAPTQLRPVPTMGTNVPATGTGRFTPDQAREELRRRGLIP